MNQSNTQSGNHNVVEFNDKEALNDLRESLRNPFNQDFTLERKLEIAMEALEKIEKQNDWVYGRCVLIAREVLKEIKK